MLNSLWERLLEALKGKIPETALDSWLRPCRLAALDGDLVRILAPNKFARDWLAQHHVQALETAARDVLGRCGFEPRSDAGGLILANCPFHALAQDYTDLVCGMNLDLMDGLLDGLGRANLDARLDPAPDRCCVSLCRR